jgi:hypothetical protein
MVMTPPKKKRAFLVIELDREIRRELKSKLALQDLTISKFIRQKIEEYLNS